ncbi:MAG: histidine phosphatase family protein [Peptostreptococcaceae bacterium]|nr:histidine phosphatase family protein [Peptostreptococcaceae bacterium]
MLYIMRHGKTDWNAKRKLQGRTDIPLNEEGREMARQAASAYRDVHFDICYCSPLARAKETAEIVLQGRNVPIVFDERLREMSFGVYEGLEKSFEIPDCPVNLLFQNPEAYVAVEDGESLAQLYERTGEFLNEVVKPALEKGMDILIIGHGAMNCSIICQVKNLPLEKFWSEGIENCKLKKLL